MNNLSILKFIPGTCFWFNPELLLKYKLWEFYDYFDPDISKDYIYQQVPHSIERLIGLIITNKIKI